MKKYDENNIFAKILRYEIPCTLFGENEETVAIYDINPQDKTHILVIPKKPYIDYKDFMNNSSEKERFLLNFLLKECLQSLTDYKIITNGGKYQDIPHFHVHILSSDSIL
jgi:histidine triad (HIT) family protein